MKIIEIPENGLHIAMWMLFQTHQGLYFIMLEDGSIQVNQGGKDGLCVLKITPNKERD